MKTNRNNNTDFHAIKDEREKKEYLKTTVLDDTTFNEFYNSLEDVELIYLSLNASLTQEMINQLFEKSIDNININLLKNKVCPKEKIEHYLTLNDKFYNIALAHNESLSLAQFYKLLRHLDLDVNISLAFNVATPKEVLKELALLNNRLIDEALCSHANTPLEVLQKFLYDDRMRSCLTHNETFQDYAKNI